MWGGSIVVAGMAAIPSGARKAGRAFAGRAGALTQCDDSGAPLELLKCSRRVPGSDAAFALARQL